MDALTNFFESYKEAMSKDFHLANEKDQYDTLDFTREVYEALKDKTELTFIEQLWVLKAEKLLEDGHK